MADKCDNHDRYVFSHTRIKINESELCCARVFPQLLIKYHEHMANLVMGSHMMYTGCPRFFENPFKTFSRPPYGKFKTYW